MKKPVHKTILAALGIFAAVQGDFSAQAANLYWDTNGATAGSGGAVGTWGTSTFWTSDVAGLTATGAYVSGSDVFFSAGTNGTAGTVTITGTQTANSLTFTQPGAITLTGGTIALTSGIISLNGVSENITSNITGANGLTLSNSGAGSLTLNANNTGLSGAVAINSGTVILGNNGGAGTGAITIGAAGTLDMTGRTVANSITGSGTLTVGNNTTVSTLSAFAGTINVLSAAGGTGKININAGTMSGGTINVASGGTIYINTNASVSATINLAGTGNSEGLGALRVENNIGGANTFLGNINLTGNATIGSASQPGTISGVIGESGGSYGFTKVGSQILNLTNANTYSGATVVSLGTLSLTGAGTLASTSGVTVSGGTLVVGDTASSTNKINTAAVLTLGGINGGGTFTLTKPGSGATAQTFSRLNQAAGVNVINNTNGVGTLNFSGASGDGYVRSAGGFGSFGSNTISFTAAPTFAGGSSVTNSGTPANDILIGAVLNNTDFIKAASGTIGAATYTANAMGAGVNTNVTTGFTGSGSTQSIRFGTATQTLTLSGATTVDSGGILAAVNGSVITGSTITSGTNGTLWIYGNSGNNITVASDIIDNGVTGLEKYGNNILTLTGNNSFTGQVYLGGGGTVVLGSLTALGAGTNAINVVDSTTLQANVNNISIARNFVLSTGKTVTINTNGNDMVLSGVMSSSTAGVTASGFVKSGTGKLTLSGVSTFNSPTTLNVNGGELEITGAFNTLGNLGNNTFAGSPVTLSITGNGVLTNVGTGGSTGDYNFGQSAGTALQQNFINLNVSGNAQMTVGTRLFLGKAAYVTAVANQSGNSIVTVPTLGLNSDNNVGTSNIYNLNGGTLRLSNSIIGAGGVLNLNGGVVQSTGNGAFTQGATGIGSVVVKAGGAIFDTQSFTTTVAPTVALSHDATLGSTPDGGVTKNGAGTLILGGVSTYTGTTTVNAGTLTAGSAAASALSINTNSNQIVTTTSTAGLVVGQAISGAGIAAGTYITGITNATTFTISANATATATGVSASFAANQGLGSGALVLANTAGANLNLTGTNGASVASISGGGTTGGNIATTNMLTTGTGNTNTTYDGVISGTGGLSKTGTGTQTITGTQTYTGATTVNGGTLLISGTGSVNTSSGIALNSGSLNYNSSTGLNRNVTLAGGTFRYNSATNYSGTLTFTSGTVAGSNLSGLNLTIDTGKIMSPGNSTGTMTAGNTVWANGGTFVFELNNATGTAGSTTSGWDLLNATTLTSTAGSGQFTLQIASLTSGQVSGLAQNFSDGSNYTWLFVDAGSAITGFSASSFVLDTTGFQNSFTGTFSVSQGVGADTDKLFINYTAVPEPSTYALLGLGLVSLYGLRRKARKTS